MSIKKPSPQILKALQENPLEWAREAKIPSIVSALKYLSDLYYNTGSSLVTDKIFDDLKDILKERDPTNKYLKTVGAPVSKDAVKLPYYMGSLDKIVMDPKKLSKFISKYQGPYVLSDKLDGISGQLFKEGEKNIKLFTRGNGTNGQDVSHLIKYLVCDKVLDAMPIGMSIRGEIIMSKKSFATVQSKYDLKNARNATSGIVNAKKPTEELVKLTEFIAYGILSSNEKISSQLSTLEKLGIPTVGWISKTSIGLDSLTKYFNLRIKDSDYEIDGIVVIDDSKGYVNPIGKNPDFGFAFKNQDVLDSADVKVVNVEWHGSKDSYLVPTVFVEPVSLDGVIVNSATGHNAKFIVDNKLGPGSIVRIIRSGSVIPHITEIIKGTTAQMPNIPEKNYKWSKSGVNIIYVGKQEKILNEIATSYIKFFFETIGVKNIGEGIIAKLVDQGYKTPIDVISANTNNLYKIHGLGKKIIDKIYKNIDLAFGDIQLSTLMAASNMFGRGIGNKKIDLILKNYPNILEEDWTEEEMKEKVLAIKGFDELTAYRFSKNFKNFVNFYENLKEVIEFVAKIPNAKKINCVNEFTNKTVVFTGFRNKKMEEYIESCNGKVSNSVSKNTYLLVYADIEGIENNGKYKKANSLGINIMTDEEFENNYL